jgi:hypothetical protein
MDDREPWDGTEADDLPDEALEEDEATEELLGDDADDALEDDPADALDDDLDDDLDADPGATWVHCPYCGEAVELLLDPAGGDLQEYVEDCEVCCRPWRVEVTYDETGAPSVELFTDDE